MPQASRDDTELVLAAKEGDLDAFESLVREHTPAVWAHAVRFFADATVADDVVQEVWVKVLRALDTFDGRARFSTWLFRVTRNTCVDFVRRGARVPVPSDTLEPAPLEDFADAVVLAASLEQALATLPQEDREALSAVSVFGLTYAEAAETLGVPSGTVKSRVFRARRMLSAALNPAVTGGA
jgi:RNA polymerase sigma-70 factor, ECF subfamily